MTADTELKRVRDNDGTYAKSYVEFAVRLSEWADYGSLNAPGLTALVHRRLPGLRKGVRDRRIFRRGS
jgi:hypothetical protein